MGVKDLTRLLKKSAPSSITRIYDLDQFRGTRMAVDTKLFAMKFLFTRPTNPYAEMLPPYQFVLTRTYAMITELRGALDILPVWCLDGPKLLDAKAFERRRRDRTYERNVVDAFLERQRANLLREMVGTAYEAQGDPRAVKGMEGLMRAHAELERKATKEGVPKKRLKVYEMTARIVDEYMARVEAAVGEEEEEVDLFDGEVVKTPAILFEERLWQLMKENVGADALELRTKRLTAGQLKDLRQLIELLGCPVFVSPHEGEAMCAHLTHNGVCSVTATEDMDAVIFGDGKVLRNFTGEVRSMTGNGAKQEPFVIDPAEARKALGFTKDQMIDLAILLGTDFTEGKLTKVGMVTALKLMQKLGSIEAILAQHKYPSDLKTFDYETAREVYKNIAFEGLSLPTAEELEPKDPDWTAVAEFLYERGVLEHAMGITDPREAEGRDFYYEKPDEDEEGEKA
ncbi:hypothetical protein HK101_010039 [Irineochytrium annulatum]|nr:hypothetical protein HK101_010039 [Irineochytrium annulatum]